MSGTLKKRFLTPFFATGRRRVTVTSLSPRSGPKNIKNNTTTRPGNTRRCLNSLRDACRRFSIDTDRVYLSGYSMGGDAAWDIGLAHPDLWAGVIPISALADRYCTFYWENAKYVPFYVILGELDGAKLTKNALRSGPLPETRFRCHGHRVRRPGPRRFPRRNTADLRLDGPVPPQFLPPRIHLLDDARLGQFFLVGGIGGHAAQIAGRSRRLAPSRRSPARADQRHDHQ